MTHHKPLAAPGLVSYRYYNGAYGWVMIGARDNADALREAGRSIDGEPDASRLQRWDGARYMPAIIVADEWCVKIKLPSGAWQWVIETPEGFVFSIYSTNAVKGDTIFRAKAAHPEFQFGVFNRTSKGWQCEPLCVL